MNAKIEALAYRVWANATPKGWDCLMSDVAEEIGVSPQKVSAICAIKGWANRFRVSKCDNSAHYGARPAPVGLEVIEGRMERAYVDA